MKKREGTVGPFFQSKPFAIMFPSRPGEICRALNEWEQAAMNGVPRSKAFDAIRIMRGLDDLKRRWDRYAGWSAAGHSTTALPPADPATPGDGTLNYELQVLREEPQQFLDAANPRLSLWLVTGSGLRYNLTLGVADRLIIEIIELGAQGNISKLRQCERCSRWIYVKQDRQRCCSSTCRQALFQKDEKVCEKRNACCSYAGPRLHGHDPRTLRALVQTEGCCPYTRGLVCRREDRSAQLCTRCVHERQIKM